jgi:hypothetical protein
VVQQGESALNTRHFTVECFTACELLVLESAQLDKMRRDFVGVTESFFKLQMQQYK